VNDVCLQTSQNDRVSALTQGQRLLVKVIKANGLRDNGSYSYTSNYYTMSKTLSYFRRIFSHELPDYNNCRRTLTYSDSKLSKDVSFTRKAVLL